MATDPIICKACSFGPCKLGDIAKSCQQQNAPDGVITVQDMVNYQAVLKQSETKDKAIEL